MKSIHYIYIVLFFLTVSSLKGQETIFEGKTVTFSAERAGGIGMHTNGFHGFYRFGKYLNGFNKRMYEIEIANIRHPKEVKSVNPLEDGLRGYIFGKMNGLYVVRPSIGWHNVFIPKQSLKGVSIAYLFHVGPSLGITKPVYLNIEKLDATGQLSVVQEKYDPKKHDQGQIYGRASFFNGFNELKMHPGLFAKAALQFDYGGTQEDVRALEVGIMADIYPERIPIMAFTTNRKIYLNLYVALLIGKRDLK